MRWELVNLLLCQVAYLVPTQTMQEISCCCLVHQNTASYPSHKLRSVYMIEDISAVGYKQAKQRVIKSRGTWFEGNIIADSLYSIFFRLQGTAEQMLIAAFTFWA